MTDGRTSRQENQADLLGHDPDRDDTLLQSASSVDRARDLSRQKTDPPIQIPGYQIQHCLGEGAYGEVWKAREQNTGKQVAVKFYTHRRGLDWSLLNREVEKLAVLYTSRNIVGLLDVGWDSDPPYYIMEFLPNGSLSSFVANEPLPVYDAVRIAKSVLQALVHAHGSGILHCDLKPANVLLDADLEPRLCDFGQSRLSDEQDPALGTFYYMAPEQADLKAVPDARWDVYSLGALLYFMLCGKPPYRNAENERRIRSAETLEERLAIYQKIVRESARPNRHRKTRGVDKTLADIVDRCLHVDPRKRFPNAQAVVDMLEARERQRSRRPLMAATFAGLVLLFAAMVGFSQEMLDRAVVQARTDLTGRVLQGDVVTVQLLARSVQRELQDRQTELVKIASDERLREFITNGDIDLPRDNPKRSEFMRYLDEIKTAVDVQRIAEGRVPDTSLFINNEFGIQRWRHPLNLDTVDESWAHRDYFHGRGIEYPKDEVPNDIRPITKPHVSLAFRSGATLQYMVAIAVPIWNAEEDHVIGILARTVHLTDLLAEYTGIIRGQENPDTSRIIALADHRDGRILARMATENGESQDGLPHGEEFILGSEQIINLARLHSLVAQQESVSGVDRTDDYKDPVESKQEGSTDLWLATFWPVGETGWTAIVQERKNETLRPVDQMQSDLGRFAITAIGVSCVLIGALWFVVWRSLDDRGWRDALKGSSPRPGGVRNGSDER